ncbi:hypothetical protein IQ07DRAFT_582778 [Pyrenochaeta sp. DS3sAY3a]|nr:hypothetical protein IQ07DRAFT_582778 [Pyrenochaeta sp. DS3sAY3a]
MLVVSYSLQETVIVALGQLVTLLLSHTSTPSYLYSLSMQLFSSSPVCLYAGSMSQNFNDDALGLAGQAVTFFVTLCTAPHFFPQYAWRYLFPPPCGHRRCMLRQYVVHPTPPRPLYEYFIPKEVYQPIRGRYRKLQARKSPKYDPNAFPFLRLPIEIRNLIYLHASGARRFDVRYQDPWRVKPLRYHPVYDGLNMNATPFAGEYDPSQDLICHHYGPDREDGISYQLGDKGVIAYHGSRPPTNLLLVCKQIFQESREQFLSTAAFEVQPLTPNDTSWRLDTSIQPTYEALADCAYASLMRKVRVRIDLSSLMASRQSKRFPQINAQICTFDEISLEVCSELVASLAEKLCEALRTNIPNLKAVEIHWVDDFPEAIEDEDLQMRANVLAPFARLPGVRVKIAKLVVAERRRMMMTMLLNQVLRDSSLSG